MESPSEQGTLQEAHKELSEFDTKKLKKVITNEKNFNPTKKDMEDDKKEEAQKPKA